LNEFGGLKMEFLSMEFLSCEATPPFMRKPPNKKIGGLAVCQAVRISVADP
jgi:hypothetical protein